MKRIIVITMAILSFFTGCKSKKAAVVDSPEGPAQPKEVRTMPEGRLLQVTYFYQGMMMMPFGHFDLNRNPERVEGNKFTFHHYNSEVTFDVPDSLFDAARRIIEEEKLYELESSYRLPPELERGLLDGYHWGFSATFEGKQSISSGGSHVSPGGDGLYKLRQLLEKAAEACVNKAKGESPENE